MTPKELHNAVEIAAEAAYDRFYEIGPALSDLGYVFQSETTKRAWREVVLEVVRALGETR